MSVETNSHNYTNMIFLFSQLKSADFFPKTPSPKPARIPPPFQYERIRVEDVDKFCGMVKGGDTECLPQTCHIL